MDFWTGYILTVVIVLTMPVSYIVWLWKDGNKTRKETAEVHEELRKIDLEIETLFKMGKLVKIMTVMAWQATSRPHMYNTPLLSNMLRRMYLN